MVEREESGRQGNLEAILLIIFPIPEIILLRIILNGRQYCLDELTGFIIAVTLVRPEKKLEKVTLENILSKWDQKVLPQESKENRLKCVKKN